MRPEKTFIIKNWNDWDDIINDSIRVFFETYSVHPNILLANTHTFSQFDFITTISPKRDNAKNDLGKSPENNEEITLISFENAMCDIDFSVDEKIEDKRFVLIYDTEPDWGDNTITISTPEKEFDKIIV